MKPFLLRFIGTIFILGTIALQGLSQTNSNKILFPEPFAFAIDDMGWIQGTNIAYDGPTGPYRLGVDKRFDVSDYKAVVKVGKS